MYLCTLCFLLCESLNSSLWATQQTLVSHFSNNPADCKCDEVKPILKKSNGSSLTRRTVTARKHIKAEQVRFTGSPSFFENGSIVIPNPDPVLYVGDPKIHPEIDDNWERLTWGSWRPSTIPSYSGPDIGPDGFSSDGSSPAPFRDHRWLPVRQAQDGKPYNISLTPAGSLTYNVDGPGMRNWAAAAQAHYSFLTHLERQDVATRYRFDMWGDFSSFTRLNINLIAIRGSDVLDTFPFPTQDDEFYLTVTRPKELGRSVAVDGGGVAVHFAFYAQYAAHNWRGVTWTDALRRYRGYAEELVCHLV